MEPNKKRIIEKLKTKKTEMLRRKGPVVRSVESVLQLMIAVG